MKLFDEVAPDLQMLVRACGGYDKITPEQWKEFDRALKEYYLSLNDPWRWHRAKNVR